MEMMLPVFQKAVDLCNVNNGIKRIALSVLQYEESSENPVKSLQILALKVAMKEKMKGDMESSILFNLVFREPVDLNDFYVRRPAKGFLQNFKRFFTDIWTGDHMRNQTFLRLRSDPHIVHAVLEQNFQDQDTCIRLIITKTHCIIGTPLELDDYDEEDSVDSSAIIPNRENQEFDTFWAVKFFKLCMKKHCSRINLRIDGKDELGVDYMEDFLEKIIESEFSETPKEGWEQAIEQGEKIIYRHDGSGSDGDDYELCYSIKTDNHYEEHELTRNLFIHYY